MYERCVVEDSGRQVAWEERGIGRLRWGREVVRGCVGGESKNEVCVRRMNDKSGVWGASSSGESPGRLEML